MVQIRFIWEKNMLVRFSALKNWKNVKPGKFIGPAYRFQNLHGLPHVVIDRGRKQPDVRCVVFQEVAANYGVGRYLVLYPEAKGGEVIPHSLNPKMRWGIQRQRPTYFDAPGAEIDRIRVPEDGRGSGIASVLGNIFLRNVYEEGIPFRSIFTTRTAAWGESDLSIVGWLAKFGIDSYRARELEEALDAMLEISTPMGINAVSGRDDLFYISWVGEEVGATYVRAVQHKVFLMKGASDLESLKSFIFDKKRLEKMIRAHEAYVSMRMHMDPEKAEAMEAYAAALPENPEIERAGT